jgi:hypothetical protein
MQDRLSRYASGYGLVVWSSIRARTKKKFVYTASTLALDLLTQQFQWLKRPGREAHHPSSSADIANGEVIPPLPHTPSGRSA